MKASTLLGLVTLAGALQLHSAGTARAGDDGWSAFGGFVGGMIVNEVFHHGHSPSSSTTVYVGGGGSHGGGRYYGRGSEVREVGRYEIRETRVWVPPRTTERRLPCGRIERRTEPGYWKIEREKVWVSEGYGGGRSCR